MRHFYLALALTGMLLLGIAIGAIFLRSARAATSGVATNTTGTYVIIPIRRLDQNDPFAVRMNTKTSECSFITADDISHNESCVRTQAIKPSLQLEVNKCHNHAISR